MFFDNMQKFNDKVFMELVSNGMTVGVSNMLDQGKADADALGENGERPIVAASYIGNIELVKLLVKHGADITLSNAHGITALMWAEENKNVELINYLEAEKERQVCSSRR